MGRKGWCSGRVRWGRQSTAQTALLGGGMLGVTSLCRGLSGWGSLHRASLEMCFCASQAINLLYLPEALVVYGVYVGRFW